MKNELNAIFKLDDIEVFIDLGVKVAHDGSIQLRQGRIAAKISIDSCQVDFVDLLGLLVDIYNLYIISPLQDRMDIIRTKMYTKRYLSCTIQLKVIESMTAKKSTIFLQFIPTVGNSIIRKDLIYLEHFCRLLVRFLELSLKNDYLRFRE